MGARQLPAQHLLQFSRRPGEHLSCPGQPGRHARQLQQFQQFQHGPLQRLLLARIVKIILAVDLQRLFQPLLHILLPELCSIQLPAQRCDPMLPVLREESVQSCRRAAGTRRGIHQITDTATQLDSTVALPQRTGRRSLKRQEEYSPDIDRLTCQALFKGLTQLHLFTRGHLVETDQDPHSGRRHHTQQLPDRLIGVLFPADHQKKQIRERADDRDCIAISSGIDRVEIRRIPDHRTLSSQWLR